MVSGRTTNFGLNTFGPDGRITDEGNKFSLRDRETLDNLLFTLFQHDHRATTTVSAISGANRPTTTVSTTGGTLPASSGYYYAISFVDADGNETQASTSSFEQTADPLATPPSMSLSTATTGGTLEPGTYKYALSYYESGGGETRASNEATITVPTGTSTNTVTITLDTLPAGATGWRIYRRAPGELEFFRLDQVTSGPTYVDDGSDTNLDCTIRRPLSNTTSSTNKITVAINTIDTPLDTRISSWKIYRTQTAGSWPTNSLLATVTETTTQGGADLVTSFEDTGGGLVAGVPVFQTTVPPSIPQLDASDIFSTISGYLPQSVAPQGIRQFYTFLPGTTAVQDYNQFYIPHDMRIERMDAYYTGTNPSGLDGSNNLTIRVSDDSLVDEVQSVWNDSTTTNEQQNVSHNATGGTFTLSFDGQGPTPALPYNVLTDGIQENVQIYNDASSGNFTITDGVDTTSNIAYNAAAGTVETRLETDITSITNVTVTGAGTLGDPWDITYEDPFKTPVTLLSTNDGGLTGGTSTVTSIAVGAYGIKSELEKFSNITTVNVTGQGTTASPWVVEFVNPGAQNVAQMTFNDASLTGGSMTLTTGIPGSDGGTFTLSDGTDTTSAIDFDAAAATVETRLQTDITAYVDVNVTGTGTEADPWLVTFVNPGDQDVDLMIADDASLNGATTVTEVTKGRGNSQIDLLIDQNQAFHSFTTPSTDEGEQEAESSPAVGGSQVSDTFATNDVAMELDAQFEKNYWPVGALDVGDYTADFYVSDQDGTATYQIEVQDRTAAAEGTLTVDTNPSNNDTMTIDTKVYTFQTTLTDVDGNIEIGGSLATTQTNIENAINLTGTPGTGYAASMTEHPSVSAGTFAANDCVMTADVPGTDGNSIATTETFTAGTNVFDAATLGTTTAGAQTSLAVNTYSDGRFAYLPARRLEFTAPSGNDTYFEVEKTDTGSDAVRIDKYNYDVVLPTLYQGQTGTIEVVVTGSPTHGQDIQLTIWY